MTAVAPGGRVSHPLLSAALDLWSKLERAGSSDAGDPPQSAGSDRGAAATRVVEPLIFKLAETREELDQVHRLNHHTFVEEIPQHGPNPDRRLVAARLARSVCFVAKRAERVVRMVAISAQRPFSLDAKLPQLESYLPRHDGLCEIRLMAVEPDERGGAVFAGLVTQILAQCRQNDFQIGLISGTTQQLGLYRHLGFVPFGPLLGSGEARFQGMYITWERVGRAARRLSLSSASPRA